MGGSAYDEDVYAWSREQASALRRLAEVRRDLPNELDLEHVAEEIEEVGGSELHRVESVIELLLIHLLKAASAPQARAARHWLGEIEVQGRALRRAFRASMRQNIEPDDLWDAAVKRADARLDEHGEAILPGLPRACPFSLEELAGDLGADAALSRLRTLASA